VDVVTVAGDHVVVAGARGFHHAVAAGFLAGIEVQKTADLAFDIGLIAALFETAVQHHFAQHAFLVFNLHSVTLGGQAWKKRRKNSNAQLSGKPRQPSRKTPPTRNRHAA